MKPIDVIQRPINSSIEEWCIKQAKKNEERVKQIMRAAGIPLAEAVEIKAKEDEDKFNAMIEREIKKEKEI